MSIGMFHWSTSGIAGQVSGRIRHRHDIDLWKPSSTWNIVGISDLMNIVEKCWENPWQKSSSISSIKSSNIRILREGFADDLQAMDFRKWVDPPWQGDPWEWQKFLLWPIQSNSKLGMGKKFSAILISSKTHHEWI
jgi:hypothetical protein